MHIKQYVTKKGPLPLVSSSRESSSDKQTRSISRSSDIKVQPVHMVQISMLYIEGEREEGLSVYK